LTDGTRGFVRHPYDVDKANPDDFGDSYSVKTFPANTTVDVLRGLRNARNDQCAFAAVRVVDAGGVVPAGGEYVVPLSSLSETSTGQLPADGVRQAREKRTQEAKEMAEEELRTGRCVQPHVDDLRRQELAIEQLLPKPGSSVYTVVGNKLVVATREGAALTIDVGLPGEHHVIAVSYSTKLKLSVLDDQDYPVTTESPLLELARTATHLPSEATVVSASGNSRIKVQVSGGGCTLVMAIRRD
jgi:hypothetical protein